MRDIRSVLAALAGLLTAACVHAQTAPASSQHPSTSQETASFVVVDRGNGQYAPWKRFDSAGISWLLGDLPDIARIAVVMPDRGNFSAMSADALRDAIFSDLRARVDAGLRNGQRVFEIHLVENLTVAGYFSEPLPDVYSLL